MRPLVHELADARRRLENATTLRPYDDWHEDFGEVLWWSLPIKEPPYVGSPLETEWPGNDEYLTHWTPFLEPSSDGAAAPASRVPSPPSRIVDFGPGCTKSSIKAEKRRASDPEPCKCDADRTIQCSNQPGAGKYLCVCKNSTCPHRS